MEALSIEQINNLQAENETLQRINKEYKYALSRIWNITEHQINFNAYHNDQEYTVNDLKKIQETLKEVMGL